jgi:hypothetical protein
MKFREWYGHLGLERLLLDQAALYLQLAKAQYWVLDISKEELLFQVLFLA